LRDLIIGLLAHCRVYLTDWTNIRHVPADHGSFGLDTNISCLLDTIKSLPPALNVIALCQSGVPAFAAPPFSQQTTIRERQRHSS